jgi:3-deoxy-D-arabino-heptulosonate 7-phosphate (DAHP) synthase
MKYLSYAYRFVSNFAFLALVYFSLNFIGGYQQRTIVAALVLAYAAMRAISALRTFYFFNSIERLEFETRRLGGLSTEGPVAAAARKGIVKEVVDLRQAGEVKSYIDLLFLGIIVVLCVAKIFAA